MGEGPQDRIDLRYYAVCLIDIQGQGSKLDQWRRFPSEEPDDDSCFWEAVRGTLGTVDTVRRCFREWYSMAQKRPPEISGFNEQESRELQRMNSTVPNAMCFSDTIVFFSEVSRGEQSALVYPLLQHLITMTLLLPAMWASKIPIRGAIHVGIGASLGKDDFYGPALADAYRIESKQADWPRVLVSNDAIEFFRVHKVSSSNSWIQRENAACAEAASLMLKKDEKGLWMLDFLSPAVAKNYDPTGHMAELILKGYKFVCDEHVRFAGGTGDPRLAERYAKLKEYFESRMVLWGLGNEIVP